VIGFLRFIFNLRVEYLGLWMGASPIDRDSNSHFYPLQVSGNFCLAWLKVTLAQNFYLTSAFEFPYNVFGIVTMLTVPNLRLQ
jgi:hypothetical protein